jgi:hypothetical protein
MFKLTRLAAACATVSLLVLSAPTHAEEQDIDVNAAFRTAILFNVVSPVRFNAVANEYITYAAGLGTDDYINIGTDDSLSTDNTGAGFFAQHTTGTAGEVVIGAAINSLMDISCDSSATLTTSAGSADAALTFVEPEIALTTGGVYVSSTRGVANTPADGTITDCSGVTTETFTSVDTGADGSITILIGGRIQGITAATMSPTAYSTANPSGTALTLRVTYN